MSKPITIAPFFVPKNNQIAFGTKDLNTFQRATYADTFGAYQKLFGLFGYMKLDRANKFIVHTPKGSPLMWQELKACAYDPTRSLTVGKRELEPEKMYIFEQFCWDELFDSCFEHMLVYSENGDIEMSPEATQIFNELVKEMVANAHLGARASLTSGRMYDVDAVDYAEGNTANITSLFKRTHATLQGWIPLMRDLAAQEGMVNLNTDSLHVDDFTTEGYQRPVVDLYDDLKGKAPKELRRICDRGGVITNPQMTFRPLFPVSPSIHAKLVKDYQEQNAQLLQNNPRISKRQANISANGLTQEFVFYIDETPVIPIDDVCIFDDYVNADTHFAGIVASGNIQMGFSFGGDLTNIEGDDIGILIEQNTSISTGKYKQYSFLSHAIAKTAIADPNYAVCSILATTSN